MPAGLGTLFVGLLLIVLAFVEVIFDYNYCGI